LSCGRKLTRSPLCPERNPFRIQEQKKLEQQAPSSAQQPIKSDGGAVTSKRNSVTLSTRDGWIVTNVLLVYILNPSIVKSCFQMLQLESICETKYWSLDDTITFDDVKHQNMILFVVTPSLLFYGVVCPLLVMLYIGRHADRQTNRKLMFRYGLLYSGFAPKYWFYELILFLRKLLIILIVTFASSHKQQLHFALGMLIVLLCLLEHLRPYNVEGSDDHVLQSRRLHRMEFMSMVILIGMVWSAVFFVLGCNDDHGTCSMLGVGVLGSNLIFALGSGYTVAKAFQKKNRLGEKLVKLSSALSSKKKLLGRGIKSEGRNGGEGDGDRSQSGGNGDKEIRFDTVEVNEGQGQIGCTVKNNLLNCGAAKRSEFAARRKSSVLRLQLQRVSSGSTTGSSSNSSNSSSSSSINATTAAEIEMTSVETKTTVDEEEADEDDDVHIFVDEETGSSYAWNCKTGETKWC
jgi:hypothetical protein